MNVYLIKTTNIFFKQNRKNFKGKTEDDLHTLTLAIFFKDRIKQRVQFTKHNLDFLLFVYMYSQPDFRWVFRCVDLSFRGASEAQIKCSE
jgi:hypothetical protein